MDYNKSQFEKERLKKIKTALVIIILLLCSIPILISNPNVFLQLKYNQMFTKKIVSAEGKFYVKIPNSWIVSKNSLWRYGQRKEEPHITNLNGESYLKALNEYFSYSGIRNNRHSTKIMYAYVSVSMKTLPIDMHPSEYELHEALLAALQERLDGLESIEIGSLDIIIAELEKLNEPGLASTHLQRLDGFAPVRNRLEYLEKTKFRQEKADELIWVKTLLKRLEEIESGNLRGDLEKIRFEYERVGEFDWAKTSLTYRGITYEFWQTVDSRNNHYTIMFETDNISRIKSIFANIIKSFTLVK